MATTITAVINDCPLTTLLINQLTADIENKHGCRE